MMRPYRVRIERVLCFAFGLIGSDTMHVPDLSLTLSSPCVFIEILAQPTLAEGGWGTGAKFNNAAKIIAIF